MSRVGKQPIPIPSGVTVTLGEGAPGDGGSDGTPCTVKGPKGELSHTAHPDVRVTMDGDAVIVTRPSDAPEHRALHGLTRALLANMVTGVTDGFRKTLEIVGTGYRAQLQGKSLVLNVGFSHQVEMEPLDGAEFEVETPTLIHVSGIDKQVVGQQAALVRAVRPPEPYKGKGIRYQDEVVRRKAGKARIGVIG
ncbi:MAG: 50S ribosomal protein L6 [Dehalococcoidia bacterium]|jgi:large subunit ribosomal protein L6|nr:50S ribosomal protein L6 [Dehalococcoidia bacterium]